MLSVLLLLAVSVRAAKDPAPAGVITGTGHTVGFGELKVGAAPRSRSFELVCRKWGEKGRGGVGPQNCMGAVWVHSWSPYALRSAALSACMPVRLSPMCLLPHAYIPCAPPCRHAHPHAQEEWRGEVVHLSWSPRAFLLKGLLSDEECDHLIELVRGAGGGARSGCRGCGRRQLHQGCVCIAVLVQYWSIVCHICFLIHTGDTANGEVDRR